MYVNSRRSVWHYFHIMLGCTNSNQGSSLSTHFAIAADVCWRLVYYPKTKDETTMKSTPSYSAVTAVSVCMYVHMYMTPTFFQTKKKTKNEKKKHESVYKNAHILV